MGSLHAMNSTLSLKAEFFQNLEGTNRAPLFQPCSPKRAVPSQTAWRGTQSALGTPAKQTPKTVPRNLPRRLKCWQAREQKDRAVNTNLQLRVRNRPTHISQPILHSLSLFPTVQVQILSFKKKNKNLLPVKYLRPLLSSTRKKYKKLLRFLMPSGVSSAASLPASPTATPGSRGFQGRGGRGAGRGGLGSCTGSGSALTSCSVMSSWGLMGHGKCLLLTENAGSPAAHEAFHFTFF